MKLEKAFVLFGRENKGSERWIYEDELGTYITHNKKKETVKKLRDGRYTIVPNMINVHGNVYNEVGLKDGS